MHLDAYTSCTLLGTKLGRGLSVFIATYVNSYESLHVLQSDSPDRISESRFPVDSLILVNSNSIIILSTNTFRLQNSFGKHVVPQICTSWSSSSCFFSASELWILTHGVFLWSGLKWWLNRFNQIYISTSIDEYIFWMTGRSVQEKHVNVSLNVQYVCIYIIYYFYLYTLYLHRLYVVLPHLFPTALGNCRLKRRLHKNKLRSIWPIAVSRLIFFRSLKQHLGFVWI